jgi:ADP-ribosylglycohydrolase
MLTKAACMQVGRNSPYGEQALLLLQSLAEQHKLDTFAYAELFASTFGGDWPVQHNGYRDASCKGFLRNWALGLKPPQSGAHDKQINCCTRLAPLLAMYSGHPGLDIIVEQCTRVTQNTQAAVAWASLGSRVLEKILLGQLPTDATKAAVDELWAEQDDPKLSEEAADELYIVAGYLHRVQGLSHWAPVKQAIANLGKNCHTPNSYQTPVHAVLRTLTAFKTELEQPDPLSASVAQSVFETCMREAMREGGCCASRCGVIGALLGAYLGGRCRSVDAFIPESWRERSLAFEQAKEWAVAIDALRV